MYLNEAEKNRKTKSFSSWKTDSFVACVARRRLIES